MSGLLKVLIVEDVELDAICAVASRARRGGR